MARHFTLTADGGSRGNPGPAGYGSVITENGKIIAELYDFIGIATNNVAEYSGLIAGLTAIHGLDSQATVDVKMDSKLVVEQMSGRWQIKHAGMRTLAQSARAAHNPALIQYRWIPRDQNSHADRLANKALDEHRSGGEVLVVRQNYLTERLNMDEKPTTIYFFRHGETILTPDRKFSGIGPINPALTETGLAQAGALAKEAVKLGAEVLIASPLQRTTQTANLIAEATGLLIVFDEIWFECNFGVWDGLSIEEVRDQFPSEYEAWLCSSGYQPPQGESYDEVGIRVDEGINKLVAQYPGQKIIVVTHNGVIKEAARFALGASGESIFHIDIAPCSISTIAVWPSDGLRAIRGLNELGHLR